MGSLTVLARAATRILECYGDIYRRLVYNLVWQHLRHVVTCAHIIIIAYWRFELTKPEAEHVLGLATWILSLMEPRWGRQVSEANRKITLVANALGGPHTEARADCRPQRGDTLNTDRTSA